jgi:hypothetical protein
MHYAKLTILELISKASNGVMVADIVESWKLKYTNAGQLLLNYTRQGLPNRHKEGTARYVYTIIKRGLERLSEKSRAIKKEKEVIFLFF